MTEGGGLPGILKKSQSGRSRSRSTCVTWMEGRGFL